MTATSAAIARSVIAAALAVAVAVPSNAQRRYEIAATPDAWLAPLALAASAGAYYLSSTTSPLLSADLQALRTSDIPGFDRWATEFSSRSVRTASDIALGLAVAAPLIVLTEFDADYLHLASIYAETIALTWSVTSFIKSTGRIRPLTYNADIPLSERTDPEMRQSFPSGHTSVSMAAMVFLATVYETYRPGSGTAKVLLVGGVGLGLTAGALRVFSGMHFPTDVLAGAAIGALMGYAVPKLHEGQTDARLSAAIGPGRTPLLRLTVPF